MASTTTDRLAGVNAGLSSKAPVRVATTTNITLSGEQTIAGVAVVADDRVLVKDNTDGIENGIYDAKSGAWVRSLDFDGAGDVKSGTFVVVATTGLIYRISTADDITIGTTSIAFVLMTVESASAFMVTLLDDANAAEARATLGAIATLLEDTSPQLAGFLDPNGKYVGRDKGGDIASASPLVIDTDGDYFDVTGTTGFSAMTVAANRSFVLQFVAAVPITVGSGITLNNAGSNYTTAAGDIIVCQSTAANTVTGWVVKADGTSLVASASNFEFVSTAAITAVTTIEVNNLAAGFDYIIQLEAFMITDDAQEIWMRFSDDGGISFEAGAADYAWAASGTGIGSGVNDMGDAQIKLGATHTLGNDAGNINTLGIQLVNPNASSENTTTFWRGFVMDGAATPSILNISGGGFFLQGTDAVTDVQFLFSGGSTFKAQGDITVWRRKRS